MSVDRFNVPAILIAVVVICAALNVASGVFAPLALALLIIALLWPVQHTLQAFMPRSLALLFSLLSLIIVFVLFSYMTLWAFGRTARWIINDVSRFQSVYDQLTVWLEGHGIAVAAIWTEHFNTSSAISLIQTISGRLNTTMSFWFVVLVYVFLGLPEVGNMARKMRSMDNPELGRVLLQGSMVTGAKIRRYMLVRTFMSAITGLLFFTMASAVGLPLSKEWGVLAFVLNYIPFLGPLIATLLPTLVAIVEFQYWQSAALFFVALNFIQFAVGSYIEPRVSGNALSISPFLVLFAIFFWAYMWGIFGAFIGVPITIAVLTFCDQHDRTRWLACLLGGTDQKPEKRGA
ncbi:MAG: AI-2E family transporter [Beijerinckiaceae bacterium]|jgi:AI-2 transport protein TqsA|nr:AI-2E family transporter [Beijerinckiaceae bacterium]